MAADAVGLFNIDSEQYTAFPSEKEVLIKEGTIAKILDCEEVLSNRFGQHFTIYYDLIASDTQNDFNFKHLDTIYPIRSMMI